MSHSLINAYARMHAQGKFAGYSIRPYLGQLTELVMESGATRLLDYGCGQGRQYTEECWHVLWGFMPTLYDPASRAHCRVPGGRFDGVICTDVLEHIPEDEIDDVIDSLVAYSRLWCFISVCCRPSKKHFPGGRNLHVTIKPPAWWRDKLGEAFEDKATLHLEFTK